MRGLPRTRWSSAVPRVTLALLLMVLVQVGVRPAVSGATSDPKAAASAALRTADAAADRARSHAHSAQTRVERSARAKAKRVRARAARTSARLVRKRGRRGVPPRLRMTSILQPGTGFLATKRSSGSGSDTTTGTATTSPDSIPAPRLRFGIYPGGPAGAVGPSGVPKPEDPAKRLAALQQLRGGKAFVLHLYEGYARPGDADAIPSWLEPQIREATANGYEVEVVLRYMPAASGGDVAGFTNFVRSRVRQYGAIPGVTALQVTNEANVTAAPDAADGAFPGVRQALVQGIVAADREARSAGLGHLQIGFNWAYETSAKENELFSELGRLGGSAFAAAVDWVGVDAYPGTWGPALPEGDLASTVRSTTIATMRRLREELMPLAGLDRAAIRFAENGFPTDAQRTEAMQVTVMTAAVAAVNEFRGTYGVTDYRWFDLRDADSDYASFESHYGILRDDYSPKAGFVRLRDLVAQLG